MSTHYFDTLPYRQGALGIIIDKDENFLIVQMGVYGKNQWRFAGGGIQEGEVPAQALLRELQEELGSNKFRVIRQSQHMHKYDLTDSAIIDQVLRRGTQFRGQEQYQFLVRYYGERREIRPDPVEIRLVKWVKRDELKAHFVFEGQWESAQLALNELLP